MNENLVELCEMAEDALFDAQTSGDPAYVEEALALYQEALNAGATHMAAPYLGLACIAYARKDYAVAQQLLGLAEKLEPAHPDVLMLKRQLVNPVAPLSEEVEPFVLHTVTALQAPHTVRPSSSFIPALALTQDLGPPLEKNAVSEGPEVLLLQNILHQLGYRVSTSAKFDAATRSALMKFQHDQGITLRRIVDQELRDVLMNCLLGD